MSVSSHIFKKLIPSLDTTKYYLKYKISSQIEKAVNSLKCYTNKK